MGADARGCLRERLSVSLIYELLPAFAAGDSDPELHCAAGMARLTPRRLRDSLPE